MKTIMANKSILQDLPSRRQFHWTTKVSNEDNHDFSKASAEEEGEGEEEKKVDKAAPLQSSSSKGRTTAEAAIHKHSQQTGAAAAARRKLQAIAVSRLRSVLTALGRHRAQGGGGLGTRVVGTLFGCRRRGHVHFALQKEPSSPPVFLIELATPITGLVREMASGLVRIALECDKGEKPQPQPQLQQQRRQCPKRLLEEGQWRTYCNGKRCGFATRRECGPREWNILKAVEPISMGAGVLPAPGDADGEIMYMRAKFERVVGSRDSEAFYMMNPDCNGAPELSIYLLRV